MCIRVHEPHALSAEVEVRVGRAWRPPGDPTILRPCTTGGTEGGGVCRGRGRGQRMQKKNKWKNVRGEGRERPGRGRGEEEQLRTFLQIVLLQTLAG